MDKFKADDGDIRLTDNDELMIVCYGDNETNGEVINPDVFAAKICEFLNNEQTFNEILLENRALRIENEKLNKVANDLRIEAKKFNPFKIFEGTDTLVIYHNNEKKLTVPVQQMEIKIIGSHTTMYINYSHTGGFK